MKWLFLTVLVVVAGTAAFGIYIWGWHHNGRNDAQEQAVAEAYARAIAGSCPDAPCTIEDLHRAAPGVWAITMLSHGKEHCGTVRFDAVPSADASLSFSETGCP